MRAVLKEATRGRPLTQARAHLYALLTVDTACPSSSHSPLFPWNAAAPSSDSAIDPVSLNHPGNPTPFARDWLQQTHVTQFGSMKKKERRLLRESFWKRAY